MRNPGSCLCVLALAVLAWTGATGATPSPAASPPVAGGPNGSMPAAQPADRLAALDIAGRQRMLSQRIVKAYLQVAMGVSADEGRGLLQASIERFEAQLAGLRAVAPTPQAQQAVAALQAQWTACRAVLAQPPSRASAEALYDLVEALQRAAHHTTLAFQEAAASPLGHLVNLAGRQRMLSQSMAKFHLYRAWDLLADASEMEMHLGRAHFTAVLTRIERSPHATAAIRDAVLRVRQAWVPYEQALFHRREPARMRAEAARMALHSERVLDATESLVAVVVQAARAAER